MNFKNLFFGFAQTKPYFLFVNSFTILIIIRNFFLNLLKRKNFKYQNNCGKYLYCGTGKLPYQSKFMKF